MGSSIKKIKQSNTQILEDIKYLNKITNDKNFERRVGLMLSFNLNNRSSKVSCILVRKF